MRDFLDKKHILVALLGFLFILFVSWIPFSVIITGGLASFFERGGTPLDYKCADCNVILISVEPLRADHLGCYGYYRNTSPNIDRLASEGVLFENAFSNSHVTVPSLFSIITSQYPLVHGFVYYEAYDTIEPEITIAEVMKIYGYKTIAFTSQGWLALGGGFERGFDEYIASASSNLIMKQQNNIFNWLDENHDRNFFMFIEAQDTHTPYSLSEPFQGTFGGNYSRFIESWGNLNIENPEVIYNVISLYDETVLYVDHFVGLLLEKIEELGLDEKTIVIFTSGHGQDLMDHGFFDVGELYDERIHVPLIIRLPNRPQKRTKYLAQSIDIAPTIFDMLDIIPPHNMQGESLFTELENDKYVFSERDNRCRFLYYIFMARYKKDETICGMFVNKATRGLCLGQLNISVCNNVPVVYESGCRELHQLYETKNRSLRYSLVLEGVVNNRTIAETCKTVYEEGIKNQEPPHDIAIRNENFKYIYRYSRADELYDIKQDSKEQNNIINKEPLVAEKLKNMLFEWYNENKMKYKKRTGEPIIINENIIKELKERGYF